MWPRTLRGKLTLPHKKDFLSAAPPIKSTSIKGLEEVSFVNIWFIIKRTQQISFDIHNTSQDFGLLHKIEDKMTNPYS